MPEKLERHVVSLLLENKSGTLSRVSGLFSARGYNIESLSVGGTDDPSLARMTIVANGSVARIAQIVQQLNKLVDVVHVLDLSPYKHIERELILIKVHAGSPAKVKKLEKLIEQSSARTIESRDGYYVLELVEQVSAIDAFVKSLRDYNCEEVARSGVVGIGSGELVLNVKNMAQT